MKKLVNNIIIGIEIYESIIEKEVTLSTPAVLEFKLNQKRDLIYKDFFDTVKCFFAESVNLERFFCFFYIR